MDMSLLHDVVMAMGGHVKSTSGHITIKVSERDQDVLDIILSGIVDLKELISDERIKCLLHDKNTPNVDVQNILKESELWNCIDSGITPSLADGGTNAEQAYSRAYNLQNALEDVPGAILLSGLKSGWELWVRTGAETPFCSTLSKAESIALQPSIINQKGLYAVIFRDAETGQLSIQKVKSNV